MEVGVLNGPKVQRLSPALFKHWVNLLCLASEQEARGLLPDIEDIAFARRVKSCDAETILTQLAGAGLLDQTEAGRYFPHNWSDRQRDSDDIGTNEGRKRDETPTNFP